MDDPLSNMSSLILSRARPPRPIMSHHHILSGLNLHHQVLEFFPELIGRVIGVGEVDGLLFQFSVLLVMGGSGAT